MKNSYGQVIKGISKPNTILPILVKTSPIQHQKELNWTIEINQA